MALGKDYVRQDCSLARALEVVGERWTMIVLRDCFYGVRRFADLHAHLDLPRAVLTERLSALVSAGLLERRPYAGSRHEYLLTERALTLWPAVFALAQWGERYWSPRGPRRVFSHAPCGTDIDTTGLCPTCRLLPGPRDIVVRPGPGADPTVRGDPVSVALRQPHRLLTPLLPARHPRPFTPVPLSTEEHHDQPDHRQRGRGRRQPARRPAAGREPA